MVIPFIEGKIRDDKCVQGEVVFTNLEPLANDMFSTTETDLYYGARPEQLDRKVRDDLNGHIVPSTQHDLPIAPNFFLSVKGSKGSLQVAKRQACYDGALGARGMHSLQSYEKDESTYDNTVYTITSIYLGGFLQIYTVHSVQPAIPEGRTEYCMNLLRSFAINDSADSFRERVTAYRNAKDWAKEQRDVAIKRSNEKVKNRQIKRLAINASSDKFSSFITESSLNRASTFEALSQGFQTYLMKVLTWFLILKRLSLPQSTKSRQDARAGCSDDHTNLGELRHDSSESGGGCFLVTRENKISIFNARFNLQTTCWRIAWKHK